MKLTLGIAQTSPKLGDVPANLTQHLTLIEQAAAQSVELLLFPELSLTGYNLQDLVYEVAIRPSADDPVFGPLLAATRDHGMDVVVGFVEEDRRHRFYIAQAYLSGGEVRHVHHKVYLPTYTLFDEGRYFAWGDTVRAFDTRFGRVGVLTRRFAPRLLQLCPKAVPCVVVRRSSVRPAGRVISSLPSIHRGTR